MDENQSINPYGEAGQGQHQQPGQGAQPTQPSTNSYNQSYAYGSQPTSAMPGAAGATGTGAGAGAPGQQQPASSYSPPTGNPVPGVTAPVEEPVHAYEPTPVHAHSAHAAAASKPSGGKTFLIAFAGALVACVLALGVAAGFGLIGGQRATVNLGASGSESVQAVEEEASLAEAVADKCLPSVVSINVLGQAQSSGNSIYDFLYGYNDNSGELQEVSMGSGVVLSEDGYIITNNHVVSSGSQYEVTIEGETYDADLVGTDASSDVAVLKVKDGSGFKPMTLGDSDNITIGEWVMSIGSPFGLEQSVATGIVSATSRSQIMDASTSMQQGGSGETTIYPNMIQTDAAINPGNSGGALVDANGELIGINTLITSYSGNYSGVGFAIPSNYAINLAQSIIEGKEPTRAQLGVTMTNVDKSIAQRYGFATDSGAYISSVLDGSSAQQAGLQVGDIITAFDGQKVSSSSDVMLDVRTKNPGDKVTVTINRDGETMDVEVTLGTSQDSGTPTTRQNSNSGNNGNGNNGGSGNGLNGLFGL